MDHPDIPAIAISIMQPWAWLIVNGHKDVENRDWKTKFRGPVAIHAGKKMDWDCGAALWDARVHPVTGERLTFDPSPTTDTVETGGIVGVAEIVDCVDASDSDWFVGRYGFLIRNARPVDFIPVKGALSFFNWRRNL